MLLLAMYSFNDIGGGTLNQLGSHNTSDMRGAPLASIASPPPASTRAAATRPAPADQATLKTELDPVVQNWAKSLDDRHLPGSQVLADFKAAVK